MKLIERDDYLQRTLVMRYRHSLHFSKIMK